MIAKLWVIAIMVNISVKANEGFYSVGIAKKKETGL
jgi:hypothetical protein